MKNKIYKRLFEETIRDYKNIRGIFNKLAQNKTTFEGFYNIINNSTIATIDGYNEFDGYIDFNIFSMKLSIYRRLDNSVYLGDTIDVYNDKDCEFVDTFNNIFELEGVVKEFYNDIWKESYKGSDIDGLYDLRQSKELISDEQKELCELVIALNDLIYGTDNGYNQDLEKLYVEKKLELFKSMGYCVNDNGEIERIKKLTEEEKATKELGIMGYIHSFQWKRFENCESLKNYILESLKLETYYLEDIKEKDYYDNDFQDYEINGTIEDDYLICDFTLYFTKTRNNDILITEESSNIWWK